MTHFELNSKLNTKGTPNSVYTFDSDNEIKKTKIDIQIEKKK